MTTAPECRHEIDDLMAALTEAGLLLRSNPTTQIVTKGLTWVSWAREIPTLPLGGISVGEYRRILREGEYNALLNDGGVLQLSFAFDRQRLVKHRLCWIPSPVQFDKDATQDVEVAELVDEALIAAGLQIIDEEEDETEDLDSEDLAETEDSGTARPRSSLLLVAPIRFDFDSTAASEDHAASHLTFNRATCRIPVYGAVSLGHFVRFIFRHFYADAWRASNRMQNWTLRFGDRLVTPSQQEEMFVECHQPSPRSKKTRLSARKRERARKRAA